MGAETQRAEKIARAIARVTELTRDEFLRQNGRTPILVQLTEPGSAKDATKQTLRFGTLMMSKDEILAAEAGIYAHTVRKADANAFAMMITVGRAGNNDIILPYDSVSKFHAYFTQNPDGTWTLTDAKSMNGTFLGERRLAPEVREKLDLTKPQPVEVSFSTSVKCKLFAAPAFYDFAREIKGRKGFTPG